MPLLEVNGLRHFYRLDGQAGRPALVLVHALGTDHSLWDALVAELPHWRVLRYDLRGHGATGVPPRGCTLDQLAHDLLAITSALDMPSFAVAGVSLGAMVAASAAAAAPERIRALVLCSAALRLPGPPGGGWDARARHAVEGGLGALAPAMVSRMFSPSWLAQDEPMTATLEHVFRSTDPAGYAAGCAVLRDADISGELEDVSAPALVVRGAQDALISRDAAQDLADAVHGATLATIDCGHYPMVEQPQALAQLVIEFLAPVMRAPPRIVKAPHRVSP